MDKDTCEGMSSWADDNPEGKPLDDFKIIREMEKESNFNGHLWASHLTPTGIWLFYFRFTR